MKKQSKLLNHQRTFGNPRTSQTPKESWESLISLVFSLKGWFFQVPCFFLPQILLFELEPRHQPVRFFPKADLFSPGVVLELEARSVIGLVGTSTQKK